MERNTITTSDLDVLVFERRLYEPELVSVDDDLLRHELVSDAVDESLLYWWAQTEFPNAPKPDVKSTVESVWKRWENLAGSSARLADMAQQEGLTADRLRKGLQARAERQMLIRASIATRIKGVDLSVMGENASKATSVSIADILVRVAEGASEKERLEAQGRAAAIWKEVTAGFPFDRAAALYSDDEATSRKGGELGWIRRDHLSLPLADAVTSIDTDQVTSPVLGPQGWHILKLTDFETPRRVEWLAAYRQVELDTLRKMRAEIVVELAPTYRLKDLPPAPAVDEPSVWDRFMLHNEEDRQKAEEKASLPVAGS